MSEILFRYQRIDLTSWAYLSSLLTIALFFKFNRLWSVRNLDLLGIVMLAPGLLLVQFGVDHPSVETAASIERMGYAWLFGVSTLLIIRLLFDSSMIRRPLLEPNLTVGGLAFLAISLFLFLMANVVTGVTTEDDISGARAAERLQNREVEEAPDDTFATHGPGYRLFFFVPHIVTKTTISPSVSDRSEKVAPRDARRKIVYRITARAMAIMSHLMIVIGMISIARRHFDNYATGVATAVLYLLLPYTALRTGAVTDVLPAALLVWAVVAYRRPYISGALIGMATGAVYFPIFLLPLWISFYWHRGVGRFVIGVALALLLVILSLIFTSADWHDFIEQVKAIFGIRWPALEDSQLGGVWRYWSQAWRLPLLASFLGMCFTIAFWPAHKNLGTLLSLSAAVMLGSQFWHPYLTGVAMAWYMPLALLTVFRPNLEDRFALAVVPESYGKRKRAAET